MDEVIRSILKQELLDQQRCRDEDVDVVVVAHNQPALVERCLSSVQAHTSGARVWVWDNASEQETVDVILRCRPYHYRRSKSNVGFIKPNNVLASLGRSPYVVLLNSDTVVFPGWKEALLGRLQSDHRCACVGYLGGSLDESGRGVRPARGDVTYVMGWCMAIPRQILSEFGLFDEAFRFAHCEDSDFCLRLRHHGYGVYALHLDLVHHVGGATIKSMADSSPIKEHFRHNHDLLVAKWQPLMPHRFIRILDGPQTNV